MRSQGLLRCFLLAALALSLHGAGCAQPETCNWKDDDGDHIIDEGFDADGDGEWACGLNESSYVLGGFDCDDSNPDINPSAEDTCDGVDNDCDATVDEGCTEALVVQGGRLEQITATGYPPYQTSQGVAIYSTDLSEDGNATQGWVTLIQVDPDGALHPQPPHRPDSFGRPYLMLPWQVNSDDLPDYLVLDDTFGHVYSGQSDGSLQASTTIDLLIWSDLVGMEWLEPPMAATGDLDGDGDTDLLVTGGWYDIEDLDLATVPFLRVDGHLEPGPSATWSIASGASNGPFQHAVVTAFALANLNGDEFLDLVVASEDRLAWRLNTGAGWADEQIVDFPSPIASMEVGDLNNDGYDDIALTLPDRFYVMTALNRQSEPHFATFDGFTTQTRHPGPLSIADFDSDGHLDLATLESGGRSITILRNNGGGSFTHMCSEAVREGSIMLEAILVSPVETRWGLIVGHQESEDTFSVAHIHRVCP